jgi:hypothetical protein
MGRLAIRQMGTRLTTAGREMSGLEIQAIWEACDAVKVFSIVQPCFVDNLSQISYVSNSIFDRSQSPDLSALHGKSSTDRYGKLHE